MNNAETPAYRRVCPCGSYVVTAAATGYIVELESSVSGCLTDHQVLIEYDDDTPAGLNLAETITAWGATYGDYIRTKALGRYGKVLRKGQWVK